MTSNFDLKGKASDEGEPDGYQLCREERERLYADNKKLRAELDEANRHYNLAEGLLRKSITTEDMQSLTISNLRAELDYMRETARAALTIAVHYCTDAYPRYYVLAALNRLGDKPEGEK